MQTALIVLFFILFFGVAYALSAFILMLLWNWIAAGVFGLPELSFLTAMGLQLLLGMVGSFFKSSTTSTKQ